MTKDEKRNRDKKYTVYSLTFPNGKVYIGCTSQRLKTRFRRGRGYPIGSVVRNAIDEFGWDNVVANTVETIIGKTNSKKAEIENIKKYRSTEAIFGYNVSPGGGIQLSSKIKVDNYHNVNIGHCYEQYHPSGKDHYNYGKKRSEEVMRHVEDGRRRIVQLDANTREWIKVFPNVRQARIELCITTKSINDCCLGKREIAGEWKWIYRTPKQVEDHYLRDKKF